MKKIRAVILIYMCFCLCLSTVSCGNKDYSDKSIVFATSDSVSTFDPQLCKTPVEISIASNSFEGLMTRDEQGNIVNGAIENYEILNTEKTMYSFKVKDGLMWSDGETPLTADDFVFGIKRAVLKETQSPFVTALYSIKNAEKINKGKKNIDTLGVTANADNTIIIELNHADDGLLETLTRPMCFPCNEQYFYSTNGKYGLTNKYIISNGAYSINYFNPDTKTVIIQNNDDYVGEYGGIPKQITINYSENYDDIYTDFETNEIDVGAIESSYLKGLEELGVSSELYYNTNYCLYMSESLISEYGNELNRALSFDIDNGSVRKNINDYYKEINGIIPAVNEFEGKIYRENVGSVKLPEYNVKQAEKLLGNYDSACDKLNGLSIYYPSDNERLALISNIIIQGWQKDLNVYINSSVEKTDTILSKIKSDNIKLAIIPIFSENNNANASLNLLYELGICKNVERSNAKQLFETEQSLIDNGIIYPIVAIPTAVSFSSDIEGISASSDGKVIDFRFIKKS